MPRINLIKGRTVSSVLALQYTLPATVRDAKDPKRSLVCQQCPTKEDFTRLQAPCAHLRSHISAVDHIRCITRIANKVGLSEKTKRMAVKIMRQVVAMQISAGKGPMGIVGHRALYCFIQGRGNQNTEGTFDCRWCDRK